MSNSFVYLNENNELHKFNMNITSNETNLTFDNNLLINGNLNFSGNITKNGNPFHESRWTEDSSNISYTAGNVGIGTASPTEKLDVNGEIKANGKITVLPVDGDSTIQFDSIGNKRISESFGHFWFVNNGNRMIIKSDGNIGIGNTSPSYKLDVSGSIYGQGLYTNNYIYSTAHMILESASGYDIYFNTSDSYRMMIQSGGNVGIGTTNPSYKLHVNGSLYGENITSGNYLRGASQHIHFEYSSGVVYMSNPNGTNYNSTTRAGSHISYHDNGTNLSFNLTNTSNMHTSANNYQFFSGNSEKIRITGDAKEQMKFYDNGGNHYFNIAKFNTFPSGYGSAWEGKTFPSSQMGTGEHAVIGGFNGEGYWFAQNGDAAGFSNPADYAALAFYDEDVADSAMTAAWYFSSSGEIYKTSDIRIKTEVNTYKNNNYEKYKKIRIVTYKKKLPKNIKPERLTKQSCINKYNDIHYGVIAQELYELYPELETTSEIRELQEWEYRRDNWNNGVYEKEHSEWLEKKTEFENNNENSTFNVLEPQEIFDEEEPIKSVEYQRINLLTIGIVQNLITEIETLKTENTELKTKLDELTNKIKNATTFEDFKNSL